MVGDRDQYPIQNGPEWQHYAPLTNTPPLTYQYTGTVSMVVMKHSISWQADVSCRYRNKELPIGIKKKLSTEISSPFTGLYILVRKRYLTIFTPHPPGHALFWLLLSPFCINPSLFCIYFTLLLPIFSFFTLSSFSFSFLHFSLTLSFFSFSLFIFFPQRTSVDISPEGGGGVFSKIKTPTYTWEAKNITKH